MSYVEQLFDQDFPTRREDDEIDTSFHQNRILLRRWDLIEDGWRDFLDINEDSTHTAARAQAATTWAERINWQISDEGLDVDLKTDAAILPLLQNDAINYVAQAELVEYYRGQAGPGVVAAQKADFLIAQRQYRSKAFDFISLYPGRASRDAYLGLAATFDYASLVVLGPEANKTKKMSIQKRLSDGLPSLESRVALRPRGWAYQLYLKRSA